MCVTLALLAHLNWHRAPFTQDEADLASAAVAMTARPAAWLYPDYHPFRSDAHLRLGDGLVAPPAASALMALPGVLGLRAPWAWPLCGGTLFLAGLCALVRALVRARWFPTFSAVALAIALSPRLALHVITLEAEVPLAGLCALALALAWTREPTRHPARRALAAGALLGAAFLFKLWLILPAALAVVLVFALRRDLPRPRALVALASGFTLIASSHLVLVAFFAPGSLTHWLREVYLAALGLGGIAATKWQGIAAHPEWSHGAWYYPPAIVRDLGLAAPFALLGALRLLGAHPRVHSERRARVRHAAVGLSLGLGILSVPAIKEPLYVLTLTATLASLAAYGLLLASRVRRARYLHATALGVGLLFAVLMPRPSPFADDRRPELRLQGHLPWHATAPSSSAPPAGGSAE